MILGICLLVWLAVGFIAAIIVNKNFTEEKLEELWNESGADSFLIPKSHKKFLFVVLILAGLITPAMYIKIKLRKN